LISTLRRPPDRPLEPDPVAGPRGCPALQRRALTGGAHPGIALFNRGSTPPVRATRLWFAFYHAREGARRAVGSAAAMLPILQRIQFEPEPGGKLTLGQAEPSPETTKPSRAPFAYARAWCAPLRMLSPIFDISIQFALSRYAAASVASTCRNSLLSAFVKFDRSPFLCCISGSAATSSLAP